MTDVNGALLFRAKNRSLVEQAVMILEVEKPMTLRQLYYRLLSAGSLKSGQKEYKRLGSVMTRLRESGGLPRTWIVDHVRSTLKPSSWSGLADFGETVREAYRKDFWASLDHHVEVFVEKDAIAGTIQPVTQKYDVALRVCRGYSSVSFAGEIADVWQQIEKPIYAYYLGDFDPSGFDLERDLREKLARYSGRYAIHSPLLAEAEPLELGDIADNGTFVWIRLAVQSLDFFDYNLIALPVKEADRRSRKFIDEHGKACAEVDALPPSELRRRVEEAIQYHIDKERWRRLAEVEELEKETLRNVLKNWERRKLT